MLNPQIKTTLWWRIKHAIGVWFYHHIHEYKGGE